MLLKKTITGVITLPLMFLVLYLGRWPMYVVTAVVVLVGLQELYTALVAKDIVPVRGVGWIGALGILTATQWAAADVRSGIVTACISGVVFMALIAQFWRVRGSSAIGNAGATVLGVVYVPLLFSYLLRLRQLRLNYLPGVDEGGGLDRLGAILLVVVAVWSMDIAANIVGKYLGTGHPWPTISPNKTYEGSLAGLLASMIGTLGVGAGVLGLPVLHMLTLGVVLGIVGQAGDLCESLLKRDIGIKDFGVALPGHGGVLDRFDSLLFAMPIAYYYLIYLVLPAGVA
ncbi:MAG TPA: phosphatidate cytidylyltransferase [Armatimonadota bacterium]|nr:phosphatidate cytidylyltransferase [Armatimonadota bacterium]